MRPANVAVLISGKQCCCPSAIHDVGRIHPTICGLLREPNTRSASAFRMPVKQPNSGSSTRQSAGIRSRRSSPELAVPPVHAPQSKDHCSRSSHPSIPMRPELTRRAQPRLSGVAGGRKLTSSRNRSSAEARTVGGAVEQLPVRNGRKCDFSGRTLPEPAHAA